LYFLIFLKINDDHIGWGKWVGDSLEEFGERKKITNSKRKVKGIWRF
jgi:hypothetical protein